MANLRRRRTTRWDTVPKTPRQTSTNPETANPAVTCSRNRRTAALQHVLEHAHVAHRKQRVQAVHGLAHRNENRGGIGSTARDHGHVLRGELPVPGGRTTRPVSTSSPRILASPTTPTTSLRAAARTGPPDESLPDGSPARARSLDAVCAVTTASREGAILLGEEAAARQDHPEGPEVTRADETVVADEGGQLGGVRGRLVRQHEGLYEFSPSRGRRCGCPPTRRQARPSAGRRRPS